MDEQHQKKRQKFAEEWSPQHPRGGDKKESVWPLASVFSSVEEMYDAVVKPLKVGNGVELLKRIEAATGEAFRKSIGSGDNDAVRVVFHSDMSGIKEGSEKFYDLLRLKCKRHSATRQLTAFALGDERGGTTGFSDFERALIRGCSRISDAYDEYWLAWMSAVQDPLLALALKDETPATLESKKNCPHLLSPYTMIRCRKADDGSYEFSTEPYAVFLKEPLLPILSAFDACISELGSISSTDAERYEVAYLQRYRDALSETDPSRLEAAWKATDEAWMECKAPLQVVHDIEDGYSDPLRAKQGPDFSLRFLDTKYQAQNETIENIRLLICDYYRSRNTKLSRDGLTALSNTMAGIYYIPFKCGCSLVFSYSGQSIPNRLDVSIEKGKKIYFDAVETQARVELVKAKVLELFADAQTKVIDVYKPDAVEQLVWHVAAHEVGHAIYGCSNILPKITQDVDRMLEEPRAELTAMFTLRLLYSKDVIKLSELERYLVQFALDGLRYFCKFNSMPLQPYIAFQIHAWNTYFKHGLLSFDANSQLCIDATKTLVVLDDFSETFEAMLGFLDQNDEAAGDALTALLDQLQLQSECVKKVVALCKPQNKDYSAMLETFLARDPVRLSWDIPAQNIIPLANALIHRSKLVLDAALGTSKITWNSIIAPQIKAEAEFSTLENMLTFPSHVSPDKEVRDASREADKLLSAFLVEASSRKDMYDLFVTYSRTEDAKSLEGEEKRYLERRIRDFRRCGLHLEGETSERVKEINKRISELGIAFSKNLGEENTSFIFTKEELEGCPESWLSQRSQGDGNFKVSLKYPDYIPVMKGCVVASTRRKMEAAFNSRCKDANTCILEELVSLRHEKAQLMSFSTHADFITQVRMAESQVKVQTFLDDLSAKLEPLLDSDLDKLKAMKNADGVDDIIRAWDRTFYCEQLVKKEFSVDHEKLREYFPINIVSEGLLQIYQELLGLTFAPDKNVSVWHSDVMCYKVTDTSTGGLVGWFYLDMFPREGKYGHAACFGLQPACDIGGKWQHPIAACVCNFPKPSSDRPSLLSHRQVETFFHEFGHCMHQLCSKAKLIMFAGTRVERDFVEAPSQMLENWCWETAALHRMSAHFETNEPIPDSLLQALIASRNANAGILNMRQIVLGKFDQAIHSVSKVDTAAALAEIQDNLMKVPCTPDTNMAASFGHLAGGYDAQYYGYMFAEGKFLFLKFCFRIDKLTVSFSNF